MVGVTFNILSFSVAIGAAFGCSIGVAVCAAFTQKS